VKLRKEGRESPDLFIEKETIGEGRFRSQEVTAMPKVGDKFKGLITGATYVVKKIEGKMVLLEEQNGKSQVLTELSNLKLFYDKEEKEEKTKPRYGTVNLEKRRHPRFSIDLPIEYYRIDSSVSYAGRGLNISEGGLLIYFPEQMDVSQYLRLKLFLPIGSELSAIEVLAEVAWMDIHLGESWGDYRCGVKFIDIFLEDMTKLKNVLKSLSLL
jgi:hypothetical protein